jgi:GrpB-like predicted nucleotidyltransferase (UPF0157 family)
MIHLITAYNPKWKNEFEKLKQVLMTALNDFQIDIQHIGSTAIPGLYAKPILDIDIIIPNKIQLDAIAAKLEQLGYKNKGEQGVPGRFAFRQLSVLTPHSIGDELWPEHHLYVCFSDSLALKNHIVFRDALLQDKKLAQEYAQLKLSLANEKGMTREKYTQQKTDFIVSVLAHKGLNEKALADIKSANGQADHTASIGC